MTDYFIEHMFMPNQTITAVIKHVNNHTITDDDLRKLLAKYGELNGNVVPRPGQKVKIPLLVAK